MPWEEDQKKTALGRPPRIRRARLILKDICPKNPASWTCRCNTSNNRVQEACHRPPPHRPPRSPALRPPQWPRRDPIGTSSGAPRRWFVPPPRCHADRARHRSGGSTAAGYGTGRQCHTDGGPRSPTVCARSHNRGRSLASLSLFHQRGINHAAGSSSRSGAAIAQKFGLGSRSGGGLRGFRGNLCDDDE